MKTPLDNAIERLRLCARSPDNTVVQVSVEEAKALLKALGLRIEQTESRTLRSSPCRSACRCERYHEAVEAMDSLAGSRR